VATRLPYYTGEGDIYSQLMAQFAQEQPYYSAAPFGAGFTGGYDPTLYMRTAPRAVMSDYSGLLGGAYLGGDASLAPANPVATDMNSITGGLLASLIGGNTMAAVDSVGGNAANLGPANIGLDIGLMGQAGIADTAAAMDASQAMGQGMVSMNSLESAAAAADAAAAAAAAAAADAPAASAAADAVGVAMGDASSSGTSGSACVIATHAVANGAFTPNEKRQAVKWCVKNLHRTWWGEAIRRGYRYYGRKAIEAGKAKNHYQEFRDYVAFATGTRKTPKTALTFAWRNVQFFVTGIFVKD
jgi:hypothetical protein